MSKSQSVIHPELNDRLLEVDHQQFNSPSFSIASSPQLTKAPTNQYPLQPVLGHTSSHQETPEKHTENEQMKDDDRDYDSQEQLDQVNELSDEEEEKQKEKQLKETIRREVQQQRANNKVVVGTGFSMDITEFFQFQKKKKLSSDQGNLFQEISGSSISWLILLYSIANGAMVPGWIMNIKATKFLRKTWRFLLQAIMIIPFVLYERRTIDAENKHKYTLSYIANPSNLKKAYFSSFATSFWFTIILTTFEWTYISHAIMLGSLSNFFLSIGRSLRKSSHDLQTGGQVLVICGIFLVIQDVIQINVSEASHDQLNTINHFFYDRTWYQRVLADVIALFVSYAMSQFSKYTSDMRNYYPPFLSMLLVNCFNSINMTFSAFFFNGATFDLDIFWGVFSIFTNTHFAGFMYMAILLSLGQLVSIVMISRMFPDPIIPALAMTLQPIFSSFIVQLTNVQCLPHSVTFIGYLLIVPGLMLILTGQCIFQRSKAKQQEEEKKNKELLREMQELNRISVSIENKSITGRKKKNRLNYQRKNSKLLDQSNEKEPKSGERQAKHQSKQ